MDCGLGNRSSGRRRFFVSFHHPHNPTADIGPRRLLFSGFDFTALDGRNPERSLGYMGDVADVLWNKKLFIFFGQPRASGRHGSPVVHPYTRHHHDNEHIEHPYYDDLRLVHVPLFIPCNEEWMG
jgi:hypothetical protein